MFKCKRIPYYLLLLSCIYGLPVLAKTKEFILTLEGHVFTPSQLVIPANEKVKLIIINNDPVAEEFDSFDLNREKVIFAKKKATIYIGPLSEGHYEYFGEFHPNTARGYIIVKSRVKKSLKALPEKQIKAGQHAN